jgi:hypothetical protein
MTHVQKSSEGPGSVLISEVSYLGTLVGTYEGWPDVFVKKIDQNEAKTVFFCQN